MTATLPRDRTLTDDSIGELLGKVAGDVSALFASEIELAKVELREEAKQAGRAAAMLGAGAAAAWFALTLLSFAAAWGLAEWLDSPALGFLIIGAVYTAAAALLLVQARDRVRAVNLVPEDTIATIKEDIEWFKRQKS
jgi:uncharacterized membrane protein YqjE